MDKFHFSEKIQGVSPPAEHAMEFDPVSLPNIVKQQSPAMKHFITYIIQFQILDALCMGDSTPLVRTISRTNILKNKI